MTGERKRLLNNFLLSKNAVYQPADVEMISEAVDFVTEKKDLKKYKVALLFICINPPYWEYVEPAIAGAKEYFLPGHDVDMFLWSDIKMYDENKDWNPGLKEIFDVGPIEWPHPTLMRYNLFNQQAKMLKDYDYVFYCDADMKFVSYVGDEILGDGLTAAQHPMYALKDNLQPPFEANPDSKAYIKLPGVVQDIDGQKKFKYMYYAGGFQGGTSKSFLKASKKLDKMIKADMDDHNYVARWNDESHWNKYLVDNPPSTMLTPSYVYPDSLINEYYIPIWGCDYPKRIITITKKHSLVKLTPEQQAQTNMQGI